MVDWTDCRVPAMDAAATSLTHDPNQIAFAFVQELAADLSRGRLDLPSVPDVMHRVRRVLADEDSTLEQVVRVAGSEPVLASTLLRWANSATFRTSGKPITDLRSAITRMGHNVVRGATMSLAMAQLRRAAEVQSMRPQLEAAWNQAVHVAAICCALAKGRTRLNPDEALLAGLLHNVGQIYILTRIAKHAELLGDPRTLEAILRDWHAQIGAAILQNWEIPEPVCDAVRDHEEAARTHWGDVDLTDILTVAVVLSRAAKQQEPGRAGAAAGPVFAFHALGLDPDRLEPVLAEMAQEVATLRQTLEM